jgi:N-acyl-D-amino-acid deacylase
MFDLMVRNGHVVDGTGSPWFKADLGIKDGKIVRVGSFGSAGADKIIDATGLVVSPGFIDIHSHSDFELLANPKAESKVRDGVTLEVNGNCGISAAPLKGGNLQQARGTMHALGLELDWNTFGGYLGRLERQGIAMNTASHVGHSTVRLAVMDYDDRLPTKDELEEMKSHVAKAMEEGALGLSSGLEFLPGRSSNTEELVELCKVVAKYGGIYVTHKRQRDFQGIEALKEAIEIGRQAGVPVHISHLSLRYPMHGSWREQLAILESARKEGLDVTADMLTPAPSIYGWHTGPGFFVAQFIPSWLLDGGVEKALERLRDPEIRAKIKREMKPQWKFVADGMWDMIWLSKSKSSKHLVGKSFAEIAKITGKSPWDAALDIALDEGEDFVNLGVRGASETEDDIINILHSPLCSMGSDGALHAPYGVLKEYAFPDVNSYGTFSRFFRVYVREERRFTLEEAVRKVTSIAAARLGIMDRGLLRPGMWADITVFDFDRISDKATFDDPMQYSRGIEYVLVNGETVIAREEHTGALPGKVIRAHQSSS